MAINRDDLREHIAQVAAEHWGSFAPQGLGHQWELADAINYLITSPTDPTDEELIAFVASQRKYGIPDAAYRELAEPISQYVADRAPGYGYLTGELMERMGEIGLAFTEAQIPPVVPARVTSVTPDGDWLIVRLEATRPLQYRPGQSLPVQLPEASSQQRQVLTPAVPSNKHGNLEFHLPGPDVEGSPLLRAPQLNDEWLLGWAVGPELSPDRLNGLGRTMLPEAEGPQRLLIVATSVAPAKSLAFGLAELDVPPLTYVALQYVGDQPMGTESRRLSGLTRFGHSVDWLTVDTQPNPDHLPDLARTSEVILCGSHEEVTQLADALGARDATLMYPDVVPYWAS